MKSEPYWIEGTWLGRLAILSRPRGGEWLEDEIRSWQNVGIDVVVSALTKEEIADLDLLREAERCLALGLEYVTFPVTDRGVPSSLQATAELVRQLERRLVGGKGIGIHCRAGIGRSALLAACLLVAAGKDVTTAFERIRVARACPVPDTAEQKDWVAKFACQLSPEVRHG